MPAFGLLNIPKASIEGMKYIGERISYTQTNDDLTVVISARIPGFQEALMAAWLVSWTGIGAYFIYELGYVEHERDFQIGMFVMVAFWAYFEFRIGKAFIWKRFGKELIRVTKDRLIYKRSIFSYGKAGNYFLENIKNFGIIKKEERTFKEVMGNSFWLIGTETIGFDYQYKHVKVGLKLEEEESSRLGRLLSDNIRKFRKKKK